MEMVQADLTDKKLTVTLKLNAEDHSVMGDDVRLKQIFWNVLKNAVKFTPAGGLITVESETQRENGVLTIRITDSGIGMTADEVNRVFEAFSQGDHAAQGAHQFGGLGLGLAISRMLVERHGGSISAMSQGRNQGTTFSVELPLLGSPISQETVVSAARLTEGST